MTAVRLATDRNRNIISGAIGLVVLVALVTVGIKSAFGVFDGGYQLRGRFAAAGQGLLEGSDVKVRGMTVGEVDSIELVENQALITLRMDDGTRIPETAQAVIRPKTLFGEKFVDIDLGSDERSGPYLGDGDVIEDTLGGFELERVLADAYPVLEAIDPAELAVVLDELATAGDGLGENINRAIVNGATLAELQVSNDAEIRQFLGDLALLSEEIDRFAPDVVAGAQDLNVALPGLNERSDEIDTALVQLARVSGDVADLLEEHEPFTTAAFTRGSAALQVLFDRRSLVQPLLHGLQQYTQTLTEAIRIDAGDGTLMAAVKNLVSVQELLGSEEPILPDLPDLPDLPPVDPGGTLDDLLPDLDEILERTLNDTVGGITGRSGRSSTPLLDILLGGGER